MILPFVEQGNLYNVMNPQTAIWANLYDADVAAFGAPVTLQKPVAVFICPSDPLGTLNTERPFPAFNNNSFSKSNYVANVGEPTFTNTATSFNNGFFSPVNAPLYANPAFFHTAIRDVSDGLSNTIAIGERSSPKRGFAAIWSGTTNDLSAITGWDAVEGKTDVGFQTGERCGANAAVGRWAPHLGFTSTHTGGAQFCFGDGSVRFISDSVEQFMSGAPGSSKCSPGFAKRGVFNFLGTRNGGEVVGEF